MISGEQQPEEGEIIIPKDYRIAELSQHIHFTEETVLSEAKKGLRPEQKDEIWKAEMILSGLGFTEEDFQKSPHEFSGGYQIRINLAKALLCEPDMLLLDEPTNYLDIVSLRWMERFLQKWNGEFLLVTHDRVFMDAVVSHVAIIHRQRIKKQKGKTIDAYRQIRQEEDVYEKPGSEWKRKKQNRKISSVSSVPERVRQDSCNHASKCSTNSNRKKSLKKSQKSDSRFGLFLFILVR
jgi:ATP-binding cassette subfamily F protein 3